MLRILPFLLFFLYFLFHGPVRAQESQPYVVMLSLDGFRWDYHEHANTPNLDRIAESGVRAVSLKPSFPTKTFPNHYSIATGLYPDNHGIILNDFWDPATKREYRISDRSVVQDGTFYDGEPIWVTAEKQGVRSASYFWVGSEADIQGIHPTYWKIYEHEFPFGQRIDSVVSWMELPYHLRPHLVMWYFDEPDEIGHEHGPLSTECIQVVESLDSLIGVFLVKMSALTIFDSINFIFISDHGMGPVSADRTVILSEHLDENWFDHCNGSNPVMVVKPKARFADTVYHILSHLEHISAWRHDEVPDRLNFGTHPRAEGIIIVADSAWSISWKRKAVAYSGGTHGYDNENPDMGAIFYATGPAFKQGFVHPGFNNTDIYPLLCHILGIAPAEVDGRLENVIPLLK